MKVSHDFKKEFTPISFTFTCESVEDVKFLWSLLNVTPQNVVDASDLMRLGGEEGKIGSLMDAMWAEVNDVAISLGMRV